MAAVLLHLLLPYFCAVQFGRICEWKSFVVCAFYGLGAGNDCNCVPPHGEELKVSKGETNQLTL